MEQALPSVGALVLQFLALRLPSPRRHSWRGLTLKHSDVATRIETTHRLPAASHAPRGTTLTSARMRGEYARPRRERPGRWCRLGAPPTDGGDMSDVEVSDEAAGGTAPVGAGEL